jgi:TetR/AcrR family transcriptional regulator, transcriptional repressor for nem operon
MTDSTGAPAPALERARDKRERLVEGACRAFYEQGVEHTTLADIARIADVPLGNVYYYFKTKDELVEAVIASHARLVAATLAGLERHRGPKDRLKAFARLVRDQGDTAARFGCPQGSLCSELDKRNDGIDRLASALIRIPIDWAEQQFRAMGRRDARDLAVALIASYQGISLLTNTLRDPALMAREARRLERWIDTLG